MRTNQNEPVKLNPSNSTLQLSARSVLFSFVLVLLAASIVPLQAGPPNDVYVNPSYAPPTADHFPTIQAGLNAVAPGGTVHVDAGIYVEDVTISQPVTLLGPNAGKAGTDSSRGPEAILSPYSDDPESGQIVFLNSPNVTIDGFLFNGEKPALTTGYPVGTGAARANTSAAVQNTYFFTTDSSPADHFTFQNNVVTNITYDGLYLEVGIGTENGFNYILNNKFCNMWEGLLTYAVHSVISNNTFLSVNRGLSLHGTTTAAPAGFTPVVANNSFTIGEWWPAQIDRHYTEAVWVNYRREHAAPLDVINNTVRTPVAAPGTNRIRGFYAITIDGQGQVNFIGNTINGRGNCMEGVRVALSANPGAVTVQRGSFTGISEAGVLATTLDYYGASDVSVTVSNISITMAGSGAGVLALQDPSTPNKTEALVIDGCSISGASSGDAIFASGPNATVIVTNNPTSFIGNANGVHVLSGQALVQSNKITGNAVGLLLDNGQALAQGNNLSGNSAAAIRVLGAGLVDAGDCTGADLTSLGVSTGGNNFSGYNFAGGGPYAIDNQNAADSVLAYQNFFGVGLGQDIANLMSGLVEYSQNPPFVTPPPDAAFECVGDIPAADFAGGIASASQIDSITSSDSPPVPVAGGLEVTRTWFVTDICGQVGTGIQTFHISDITPPVLTCPDPIVQPVDLGQTYATVLFTPVATDNCGGVSLVAIPPSGSHFPIGINTVHVTATDTAGNPSTCSFSVAVIGLPTMVTQPRSRTNDVGTTATFSVVASSPAPLSYQWYAGTTPLSDVGRVSGATSRTLSISDVAVADTTSGHVRVSNIAGSVDSDTVQLIVLGPVSLHLDSYSRNTGAATLSITGTPGVTYALQWSTDFVTWTTVATGASPFTATDISNGDSRMYRAVYAP